MRPIGWHARKLWSYGALWLVTACGPGATPEKNPAARDAAAEFRGLEDRLLNARRVRLDFHATAEGVVEADLRGRLDVTPFGHVRLTGAGSFGGVPVDLLLQSGVEQMQFGTKENRATAPTPIYLKEAVLVGLTRMGILHNLARLTSIAPPDHADGGVRGWVTTRSFAMNPTDSSALSFELVVSGKPSGSASLVIDSRGQPVLRRQTVQFSSGEMRVVERYSEVSIDP